MERRNTRRERREGKRKDEAEEGLSGGFKERAAEGEESVPRDSRRGTNSEGGGKWSRDSDGDGVVGEEEGAIGIG